MSPETSLIVQEFAALACLLMIVILILGVWVAALAWSIREKDRTIAGHRKTITMYKAARHGEE